MVNFKTKFCWLPVRLARNVKREPEDIGPVLEFIGWTWMEKAYLTNNINHGWINILDSKPIQKYCIMCGQKVE